MMEGYSFKPGAMSIMLSEMKAFQQRIENSILVVRRESYYIAGVLCAITMVILVAGSLYCHFYGNRRKLKVVRYVRLSREEHSNGDREKLKLKEEPPKVK